MTKSTEKPCPVSTARGHRTGAKVAYRQATEIAAGLERAGLYAEAAEQWREAEQLATEELARHWCDIRWTLCLQALVREAREAAEATVIRRRRKSPAGDGK